MGENPDMSGVFNDGLLHCELNLESTERPGLFVYIMLAMQNTFI